MASFLHGASQTLPIAAPVFQAQAIPASLLWWRPTAQPLLTAHLWTAVEKKNVALSISYWEYPIAFGIWTLSSHDSINWPDALWEAKQIVRGDRFQTHHSPYLDLWMIPTIPLGLSVYYGGFGFLGGVLIVGLIHGGRLSRKSSPSSQAWSQSFSQLMIRMAGTILISALSAIPMLMDTHHPPVDNPIQHIIENLSKPGHAVLLSLTLALAWILHSVWNRLVKEKFRLSVSDTNKNEMAEVLIAKAIERIPATTSMGKAVEQMSERLMSRGHWSSIEEIYGESYPSLKMLWDDPKLLFPILFEKRASLEELEDLVKQIVRDPAAMSLFAIEKTYAAPYQGLFPRVALVAPEEFKVLKAFVAKPGGDTILNHEETGLSMGIFLAARKTREAASAFLSASNPSDLDVLKNRDQDYRVFWYTLPFLYKYLREKGESTGASGAYLAQWLLNFDEINHQSLFNTRYLQVSRNDWLYEEASGLNRNIAEATISRMSEVLHASGDTTTPSRSSGHPNLEKRAHDLSDVSDYHVGHDLEKLSRLEGDLRQENKSADSRLPIFEDFLTSREKLRRGQLSQVIEMPIVLLHWSIAICYEEMNHDENALQHMELGLKSLQIQRRYLNARGSDGLLLSSLWPTWYQLAVPTHRLRAELLHKRWLEKGLEADLRQAIQEMKLASDYLKKIRVIGISDEDKISIPSQLALYLCELCVYESRERQDALWREAKTYIGEALEVLPEQMSLRDRLPEYRIELARGYLFMSQDKLEEAEKAFNRSWDLRSTDAAASRLMVIAIEHDRLDDAYLWAERINHKESSYYNYFLGDLEAIAADESTGDVSRDHFLNALRTWEKIPSAYRSELIRSYGVEHRFHFRFVDIASRAQDFPRAIGHIDQVLAHYREGLKPLARTLVEFFSDLDQYQKLQDHLAVLPAPLHAHELMAEVQKTLRKKEPKEGTLEFEALSILNTFAEQTKKVEADNDAVAWERLLEKKDFNAPLFERFLVDLRSRRTAGARAKLLAAWADDVTQDKPEKKRARLSNSYALVSAYVRELRWLIENENPHLEDVSPVVTVASQWRDHRRPWLNMLMMKAKNYQLINDLKIVWEAAVVPAAVVSSLAPESHVFAPAIKSDGDMAEEMDKRYPALLPGDVFDRLARAFKTHQLRTFNPSASNGRGYWAMEKKLRDIAQRHVSIVSDVRLLLWVLSLPVSEMASLSLALDLKDPGIYEWLKKFMSPGRLRSLRYSRTEFLLTPSLQVPLDRIIARRDA